MWLKNESPYWKLFLIMPKPHYIKHIIVAIFLVGLVASHHFGCAGLRKPPAIKSVPSGHCTELVKKVREFMWERHYLKALELLDEAACSDCEPTEKLLLRGEIYYKLDRWQEARSVFEEILTHKPKCCQAVIRLWYIDALEKGYTAEAKEELRQRALEYLAETPENPEVVYAAVLGLEGAKAVPDKTSIIEKYSHIIEDKSWRDDLAEFYFYDTSWDERDEVVRRARFYRREFPHHRLRYNMAAAALSSLKKDGPEAVQAEARDILSGEPKSRVLNYLCAKTILSANGDLDLAAKYIKRAIKAAKNPDPEDRYEYVDDRTWDELLAKSRSVYYAIHGRIKFLQEKESEALELFREGLAHDARGLKLHLWFAEALEKGGHLKDALSHYRTAAELSDSGDAVDGMRRLLKSEGIDTDPAEYFAALEDVPRFTDVTEEAGLQGSTGRRVAWSDIDRDGFPDLVISGRYVFANDRDGTFEDVTEDTGVNHQFASGGILADFDKNGFPDLMAFTSKNGPRLYLNRTEQGSPISMEDVTESALPVWPFDSAPTEAAAVADVDGDGAVDIYLANFEIAGPVRGRCAPDLFYLNLGDGTFMDATSRIMYSSEENMCGRGASFADFDVDGRQDLFVANYRLDPDFLLVNSLHGSETPCLRLFDRAAEYLVRGKNVMGAYGHSIGCAWGYLGKDHPALFVASLSHPRLLGLSDISALYLPLSGKEGFESHFEDLGFVYQETHSDPSFVDVDLDGNLDLFITSVYQGAPSFMYLNRAGKFFDATWLAGARVNNGWGAAWSDYDRDGDMDLIVCSGNSPRLLRNESQKLRRNWLEVKIVGSQSPSTGIGTKVIVQTPGAKGHWIREIRAGRGTGNQDEALAHFGLGENRGPFKVIVNYPSGTEVVLDEIPCCDIIEVAEP